MKNLYLFLLISLIGGHAGSLPRLLGQQSQVEQSQQFRTDAAVREIEATDEAEGDQAFFDSPTTPGDSDLGDQLLLYSEPPYNPFEVGASFSLTHTNNVLLTDSSKAEDRYAVYEAFVNYRPKFHNRLYGNFGYQHQFFHYQKRGNLNFDSQTITAGVNSPVPELWNILVYANYSYNRLTYAKSNSDGEALTEFYRSHAATFGFYKTVPFSRAHYLFFGPSGKWALTDPFTVSRDEYTFLLGYNVDWTRWLTSSVVHVTNFYDYRSNDRDDINQVLSGTLTFSPWKWLQISANTSYGTNNSTNEALNYEFFNVGGTVRAKYDF